ncbi:hypothetical protein FCOIX_12822 [Fusarium coicis]|nr:hypothetical protein FCOIX_12822 [Fusarium coicis]
MNSEASFDTLSDSSTDEIEQDRDDAQANGTIQPENPVTEAPPPTSEAPTAQNRQQTKSPTENASVLQSSPAPSAVPNVKPVPQAKTRGIKRAREPEPSPQAAKRPTKRNRQPATKEVGPRKLRKLLPKPPPTQPIQPYSISPMAPLPHQQRFQVDGRIGNYVNPALYAANHQHQPVSHRNGMVGPGIQGPCYGSWQTPMGMDPRGVAFPGNASIHRSSYMVPQMQRVTGSVLPTPMSSPGMVQYPVAPQQQLAKEVVTGSMLLSPVPPAGQIPIATENLSQLDRSMQDSRPQAVPQVKTLGVKRAREPEPPERPTGRNGRRAAKMVKPEEANEANRLRYRLIAPKPPKIDVPCQRQALPVNMPPSRADFQYRNARVSFAAPGGAVRDSGLQLNRHLQLAQVQMGFNPPVTPSAHSGSMTWTSPGSSVESWEAFSPNTPVDGGTFVGRPAARGMHFGPVLPQQQALTGMNPHSIPPPHNGHMAFSSHLPPLRQLHDGMRMGSMGHHNQAVGKGISTVSQNVRPNYSMEHLQPRVNDNPMKMHQQNGPFMGYCQPRQFG